MTMLTMHNVYSNTVKRIFKCAFELYDAMYRAAHCLQNTKTTCHFIRDMITCVVAVDILVKAGSQYYSYTLMSSRLFIHMESEIP